MMFEMKILAAVAGTDGAFHFEECELDSPRAGELLVEVEACGICHTDIAAKRGTFGTPLPAVLGHEGVGRVVAVGGGRGEFTIGDRVLMSFGSCGHCANCAASSPAYCRHALDFNLFGRRIDGSSPLRLRGEFVTGHFFGQSAFATHAVAAAHNAVRLPEDVPPALMAPLACGVQTGMGAVVNVLVPGVDDVVGIFGCGTVGLSAVIAAKISGCRRIVAMDSKGARLTKARELGATDVIEVSPVEGADPSVGERLRELGGLDVAFDNTGHPSVIELAFAALRPRGRLALAGLSSRGSKIELDPNRLMSAGRLVRGTVEGDANPRSFVPTMIDWYRAGKLPLERLVSTYEFGRIEQAASDLQEGRAIKPVLLMPGS